VVTPRRGPTRVLVVDDSVVVRQLVGRVLAAAPSTELVGVASNGRIALDKIARLRPDVVLLDLEMPELDGLQTLDEIRRREPSLPVIIFSHLTASGAAATLDALARGATSFALKPNASGIGLGEQQIRDDILPLIDSLRPGGGGMVGRHEHREIGAGRSLRPRPPRPINVSAVVMASSTGGPNALATVVPALPANLGVPLFVVQHMPAVFTRLLAERLDRLSALTVTEATNGEVAVPGHVYIAPGGRHLSLRGTAAGDVVVELTDGPAENWCRPAADVLFRAAAAAYGSGTLAVVLTGMGCDGLAGAEAVRAASGRVVVQSRASAVVASMPAAVADAGLADVVVPLEDLAAELLRQIADGAGGGQS
jgi:two-component system chemotaxis response regulator CheB